MAIPNIELSDTFSTWRDKFNQILNILNSATSADTPETLVQRDVDGKIEVVAVTETSTQSRKENINNMHNGLEKANEFRPVTYTLLNEHGEEIDYNVPGLIAEEVASIYPQLVGLDHDGNPSSVAYSRLIPILLAAVQDLSDELDEYKRRLEELESK
jgi:hypothetical protein